MTEIFAECTTCRLCGDGAFEDVISFGSTPFANSYLLPEEIGQNESFAPLEVVRCTKCFSVQLKHTVDPRILFENYLYVSGTSPTFRKHFDDYAQEIVRTFSLAEGDLVVDVGSNDGVLLKSFKDRGLSVLGVEPARNIAGEANAAGLPTINAFLDTDTAKRIREQGPVRVVTANNVFAHTHDLKLFAESVRDMLADDGVFIFEVQYLKDLIEKNLFDIVYHEHIFYHHLAPLASFFRGLGMEMFDVERVPVHGGSIRVFVQKHGAGHAVTTRFTQALQEEVSLNESRTYEKFRTSIEENKKSLQKLITDIKKEGKHIAGYGAPAKATTFSYAFGITASEIDFIVDDSPLKQGRVMPGTHIPIVSREVLFQRKPDYCLVLAWNFAEPIMKDAARFAEAGGRFILPVPRPSIV